jgi:hypothetical protein
MRCSSSLSRSSGLFATAVTLVFVAACSRDSTVPSVPGGRAVANAAVTDDSAWDTLVADVVVSQTRVDSAGRSRRYPSTSYRLERSRRPSGWNTVLTFQSRVRARTRQGHGAFDPEATELTQVQTDERGVLRIYNGHGQEIKQPDRTKLAALLKRMVPDSAASVTPSVRSQSVQPHSRQDIGWVQEYLASDADTVSRNAKIERLWGARKRSENGQNVFVHDDAKAHRELHTDPSTGLPVRVIVSRGDSSTQTIDYVYERAPDGSLIHRRTRSETMRRGGSSIMDITYGNVHLEKRGIQP